MINLTEYARPRTVMKQPWAMGAVATFALAGLLAGNSFFGGPVSQAASAVPATTTSTHEETDEAIEFAGEWRLMGAPGDSEGQVNHLDGKGTVKLTFIGSEVTWLSRVSPTSGLNDVFIDGKKVATVDRYAAEEDKEYSKAVFTKKGLAEGEHTIEVVWTGERNAKASAPNLIFDAFVVTSYAIAEPTPAPAPTQVQSGDLGGTPATSSSVADVARVEPTSSGAPKLDPVLMSTKGTKLTWTDASQYPAEYVINRSTNGYDFTPVATVSASSNSYLDISVKPRVRYTYTVSAVDSGNRVSSTSGSRWQYGQAVTDRTGHRASNCPSGTVNVDTVTELKSALSWAAAGTVIRIASGTYKGQFHVNKSGTASAPIWICGPRTAILTTGSTSSGHALTISGQHDVVVAGITLRTASKGLTVIDSDRIVATDLLVENIGEEGIHLRKQTNDSEVKFNTIRRTGVVTRAYGEGIYLGTSDANWCKYNNCNPDRTTSILVLKNVISETGAQAIEAKAGTTNGVISGNTIVGRDPGTGGDEWILVKGNDFLVADNVGHDSPENGFTTNASVSGWGKNNIFTRNSATNTEEYNTWIHQPKELPFLGNRVSCLGASSDVDNGLTNVTCVK